MFAHTLLGSLLILTLIALLLLLNLVFAVYYLFKTEHAYLWIRYFTTTPIGCPREFRNRFDRMALVKSRVDRGNPHWRSAQARASAYGFYRGFARASGLGHYIARHHTKSSAYSGRVLDQTIDDMVLRQKPKYPGAADLCYLQDADYRMDMPSYLRNKTSPVLLYTMVPEKAANHYGDTVWTFNKKGEIEYTPNGGEPGRHKLWDYSNSKVVVVNYFMWLIPYFVVWHISRKRVNPHHYLILLTPAMKFNWLYWLLYRHRAPVKYLERMNPIDGDYAVLKIIGLPGQNKQRELIYSVARVGDYFSSQATAKQFTALASIHRMSKQRGLVKTTAQSHKIEDYEAPVITEYIRDSQGLNPPTVMVHDSAIWSYTWNPTERTPNDLKHTMTPFMSPLLNNAIAAYSTVGNDERCVAERVTKIQETVQDLSMRPWMFARAEDFIEHFPKQKLFPVDVDDVFDNQSRPTQRAILRLAITLISPIKRLVKAFQKRECYTKLNDPRNISTINEFDKLHYSRVCYALSNEMKKYHWYASSKTPREIAERVAEICRKCETHAVMTDYSRFDGTISPVARQFEEMLIAHLFRKEYVSYALKFHLTQRNLKGYTKFGVNYDTGTSRLSGSPETSVLNTVFNAFVCYCAYRSMSMTDTEAWDHLGFYCGDDGISPDMDVKAFNKSCSQWGPRPKAEIIYRDKFGVNFLSRYYSREVWHGRPDSVCDILRQLSKIHVTVNLPHTVTPFRRLLEKMRGYYVSDSQTPIIGDLACAVVGLDPWDQSKPVISLDWEPMIDEFKIRSWSSRNTVENQYPNNCSDGWAYELIDRQFGAGGVDFDLLQKSLHRCRREEDYLKIPVIAEVKHPSETEVDQPCLIAGEIIRPKTLSDNSASDTDSTSSGSVGSMVNSDSRRVPVIPEVEDEASSHGQQGIVTGSTIREPVFYTEELGRSLPSKREVLGTIYPSWGVGPVPAPKLAGKEPADSDDSEECDSAPPLMRKSHEMVEQEQLDYLEASTDELVFAEVEPPKTFVAPKFGPKKIWRPKARRADGRSPDRKPKLNIGSTTSQPGQVAKKGKNYAHNQRKRARRRARSRHGKGNRFRQKPGSKSN